MRLLADYSKRAKSKCSVFVTFPYRELYVSMMKQMPVRFFDKSTKAWEIPLSDVSKLQQLLKQYNVSYNEQEYAQSVKDLNDNLNGTIHKVEHKLDTSILDKVVFKTEPREYQKEGIVFGLKNKQFLLADDMGTGKSFQSLNIARLKKNGQHCLIICGYATLQYNWKLEAEKHTNQSAYILGTRIKPRKKKEYIGTTQDKMEDLENLENISEFFIITNVNFIRSSIKQPYKNKDGENKSYKTYPVAEKINELCRKGVIGRIIFDEFQVAKSIDTDNAKAVLAITDCDYKIAATGTPLMNNHADLYTVMKWLGQMPLNYYSFVNTYCIMGGFKNQQIIGNKNNKELNIRLSNFMLRRKKSDVLDLPEKNYIDVNLLMGMLQDNLYEKTRNMLKADVAKNRSNKMKILEIITALRKVTAHSYWLNTNYTESVKFDKIQELMETITASGEKAIILSNWTTPFDGLEKYSLDYILSDYKPLAITGDVSQEQRFEYMNKFQNEDENKIIFGTYRAMGVGLTLTAANNVILLDQPWNKALEDQGIDRTHRIGTKKTVNVFKLMCHDTVDEWVNKLVLSKGKVSAETIDGEIMDEFIESLLI